MTCTFFTTSGGCLRGNDCWYSHHQSPKDRIAATELAVIIRPFIMQLALQKIGNQQQQKHEKVGKMPKMEKSKNNTIRRGSQTQTQTRDVDVHVNDSSPSSLHVAPGEICTPVSSTTPSSSRSSSCSSSGSTSTCSSNSTSSSSRSASSSSSSKLSYRWEYLSECDWTSFSNSQNLKIERIYQTRGLGDSEKAGILEFEGKDVRRVSLGDPNLKLSPQDPSIFNIRPQKSFKASAHVLVLHRDKRNVIRALIQKRASQMSNGSLLNLPGGRVDYIPGTNCKETFAQTAARELWEESRLAIDPSCFRPIGRLKTIKGGLNFQVLNFYCFLDDPRRSIGKGESSQEMDNSWGSFGHKWMTLGDIRKTPIAGKSQEDKDKKVYFLRRSRQQILQLQKSSQVFNYNRMFGGRLKPKRRKRCRNRKYNKNN